MADPPLSVRQGEYAERGDYHVRLDHDWNYRPTYLAKLAAVRRYLDALPADTRVLDAGCGEGVLVDEYASRLSIEGVDANYASPRVRSGLLTSLPFDEASFDRALCLDVLEHLPLGDQLPALRELHRVLVPGGELLLSVPNLAHLQSRLHFLLRGRLIRTANVAKHPGDRPVGEFLQMASNAGFLHARAPWHLSDGSDPRRPRAAPSDGPRVAPHPAHARAAGARLVPAQSHPPWQAELE